MRRIYMLVGVTGSGKSEYANDKLKNCIYFDHDNYVDQEQLIHNAHIFVKSNALIDVILETPVSLTRKRRRQLYQQFTRYGEIIIIFFHAPLSRLYIRRKSVKSEVLKQYQHIQVPRINSDCDFYQVVNTDEFYVDNQRILKDFNDIIDNVTPAFRSEVLLSNTSHDSPYHKETIPEHITMTIENAQPAELKAVARYHDLGKGVVKWFEKPTIARFTQHENIGAVYALIARHSNSVCRQNDEIVETIQQHMLMISNNIKKVQRLDKLSKTEMTMLNAFSTIDRHSKRT